MSEQDQIDRNTVTMAPYILDDTNNIVYDITIDSKYFKAEIPDNYFIKFNVENDDSKRIS